MMIIIASLEPFFSFFMNASSFSLDFVDTQKNNVLGLSLFSTTHFKQLLSLTQYSRSSSITTLMEESNILPQLLRK